MVPRKVWVIEGTPRNHYYLYGRLQLFVDAALYRPYWLFSYSWQGVLVKNTMCTQHWSRSNDGTFASATATAVTSVDRETDATLGRYMSLTLDRSRPRDSLTRSEDDSTQAGASWQRVSIQRRVATVARWRSTAAGPRIRCTRSEA
jgi:hypothetical protein